jgi:hypothetical protein
MTGGWLLAFHGVVRACANPGILPPTDDFTTLRVAWEARKGPFFCSTKHAAMMSVNIVVLPPPRDQNSFAAHRRFIGQLPQL